MRRKIDPGPVVDDATVAARCGFHASALAIGVVPSRTRQGLVTNNMLQHLWRKRLQDLEWRPLLPDPEEPGVSWRRCRARICPTLVPRRKNDAKRYPCRLSLLCPFCYARDRVRPVVSRLAILTRATGLQVFAYRRLSVEPQPTLRALQEAANEIRNHRIRYRRTQEANQFEPGDYLGSLIAHAAWPQGDDLCFRRSGVVVFQGRMSQSPYAGIATPDTFSYARKGPEPLTPETLVRLSAWACTYPRSLLTENAERVAIVLEALHHSRLFGNHGIRRAGP